MLLILVYDTCNIFHFSPVYAKEIIPHAYQFLMRKESILSEATFTEFDDDFLVQNVKCISITDLDGSQLSSSTTQVSFSKFSFDFYLSPHNSQTF